MTDTTTATATATGLEPGMMWRGLPAPRDGRGSDSADEAGNWLERCPSSRRSTVGWMHFMFGCARHAPWFVRGVEPIIIALSKVGFREALRPGPAANASRLLGPGISVREREKFVDEVLRSFYRFVYDVGRAASMTAEEILAQVEGVEGREHYEEARALRRGAIVATAHLGSFEVGAAALRELEEKVHVVFRRDVFAAFDEMRNALHEKLGLIPAPVEEGLDVWMSLRDALARDEVALMQADRVMPGQRGVRVPFFGGKIEMPVGPVKLAAASGAPIVPVFAVRQANHRVRLVVEKPILVEPHEAMVGGSGGGAVPSRPMLALAAAIEKQVRARPEQWLMLHDVWGAAAKDGRN